MATMIEPVVRGNEERLVQRLRERGPSTIEDLTRVPGLDWVTVFSIVDRLSRAGFVVLEKQGTDYRVLLERET